MKKNLNTIWVAVMILISSNILAGNEQFTSKIDDCCLKPSQVLTVVDDKYSQMISNPSGWQSLFEVKESKGSIILALDPNMKEVYAAFTVTVNVNIMSINKSLVSSTTSEQLELSYDPAAGVLSTDKSVYYFSDAHYVRTTVTSVTSSLSGNALPEGISLTSTIDVERYYSFNYNFVPTINHDVIEVDGSIDKTLRLNWEVIEGAEEYDLEWVFVDDYFGIGHFHKVNFRHQSTRVSIKENHYDLPLVFEKGYLLYRVRGVGRLTPDFEQRVEGNWSSFNYSSDIIVDDYNEKYEVDAHELDKLNWGYQSFYTEDGVRGEGVSYFDGTLKGRQNLSKINSLAQVIAQESVYDFQGRPAVSILPAPIVGSSFFKYYNDFNLNSTDDAYSASDFDEDSSVPDLMSTSNGASRYFSPDNPDVSGVNGYIPDAIGYPFTRTEYLNDPSGRIRKQGGLGDVHRIGGGHETYFYYGKPLQHKLTQLFGTDIGYANSYVETMVIDPNGQASVSVTDFAGRVVATNLAGPSPANLEALSSLEESEEITASILDNTIDNTNQYGSLISVQSYICKAEGEHVFTYSINPATYTECLPEEVCFDCVYDLKISIVNNETGLEMITGGEPIIETIGPLTLDLSCSNAAYDLDPEITINLPVGSYTITKELFINPLAIDYYTKQYMATSTCLLSYQDFLDQAIGEIDFSTCGMDYCTLQAVTTLGTFEEWDALEGNDGLENYNAAVNTLVSACNTPQSPCDNYLYLMAIDMSKGGQYGLYSTDEYGNMSSTTDPLSIFNESNKLPNFLSALDNRKYWRHPELPNGAGQIYLNEDYATRSEILVTWNGSAYSPELLSGQTHHTSSTGEMVAYPEQLAYLHDFLTHWRLSWALSLVVYHPEYCYYTTICGNKQEGFFKGMEYDALMLATNTYDEADNAGFFNPIGMSSPPVPTVVNTSSDTDPFYDYLTSPIQGYFVDSLELFYREGANSATIWELALTMVYCPDADSYSDIVSCISGLTEGIDTYGEDPCKNDMVWHVFRDLYLSKKRLFYDYMLTMEAIENGCYNGCIGNNDFDKTAFEFNCFPVTQTPQCSRDVSNYDGFADTVDGDDQDQPCNTDDFEFYSEKSKVFATLFDDYPMPNWPPTMQTVLDDDAGEIAAHCSTYCEDHADSWIEKLSECGLSLEEEANLKAELIELCEMQCDPTYSGSPLTTTVNDVIAPYITPDADCHVLLLDLPGPTTPVTDVDSTSLDDCGCDKLLQNQYNFENTTLPQGVTNAADLFLYNYGFILDNYNTLICECNTAFLEDAAGEWDPGDTWGEDAITYLEDLAIPMSSPLICDQCLSCEQMSNDIDDFETTYSYLVSDPSYYQYLLNFLKQKYNYQLALTQLEDFVSNCELLDDSESIVSVTNPMGKDLEKLLDKLVKNNTLFYDSSSPLDLYSLTGTTSLTPLTTGFNYWSNISPSDPDKCTETTITGNIGTVGGGSNCTITLDLDPALTEGYVFDFCDIIGFSNLRYRGDDCSNTKDFYLDVRFFQGTTIHNSTIHGTSSCYNIAKCSTNPEDLSLCSVYDDLKSEHDECKEALMEAATQNAEAAYIAYYLAQQDAIKAELKASCMAARTTEAFNMTYWNQEHHYTLYYYNQAGNLVQTVPPAGVRLLTGTDVIDANDFRNTNPSASLVPDHVYVTKYRYNTYNQLTEQSTPDAGEAKYWYDIAGRLVVSQNAKQEPDDKYSYTLYDVVGRIIEVGEIYNTTYMTDAIAEDSDDFKTWINGGTVAQITKTYYDESIDGSINSMFTNNQQNLRMRVATVAYYSTNTSILSYDNAIHYSYDIAGNVKEAIMENKVLYGNNTIKRLSYDYNLISGNVNQVVLQQGEPDQYYHRYNYDADNRIKEVFTSKDGIIWEKDAKYFYYQHGPLARVELGDTKVQGIDLAYTIQGWLKGVNSNTLQTNRDIGKDAGLDNSVSVPELHRSVAEDAFGYTLNYYNGDYAAIGEPSTTDKFEATLASTILDGTNTELFNGNIRNMVTAITGMDIYGNLYQYDQLNRLRTSTVFDNLDVNNNTWPWIGMPMNKYKTDITYDANGNILTLNRKGNTTINMDDLTYYYYDKTGTPFGGVTPPSATDDMTNKLAYVEDDDGNTGQNDYTGGDNTKMFEYDEIGNLIKDPVEQIDNIEWTVYGKVKKITRISTSDKPDLEFEYDAMGNRIKKIVKPRNGTSMLTERYWTYTYYQYDAGGNLLAIYEKDFKFISTNNYRANIKQTEVNLYGSGRLGIDERSKLIAQQFFTSTGFNLADLTFSSVSVTSTNYITDDPNLVERTLGNKSFELSNHLGNVLATVSDKKLNETGTPDNLVVTSSFEGDDFNQFKAGDYSSVQSTTFARTGTNSVLLNVATAQYGPSLEIPVQEGDEVHASVYARLISGSSSGKFVLGLKDACTGDWTRVSGNPSVEWYSSSTSVTGHWMTLSHNYTVPANLEASEVLLVIQLWNPTTNDTYFDDLSVTVENNTSEIVAYTADIKTRQMYYPFGSIMPNSDNLDAGEYTYGMNGMMSDNEVKGNGNSYTSYWRQYDPRLGRWMSLDPLTFTQSDWSPYKAMYNNPIFWVDPSGATEEERLKAVARAKQHKNSGASYHWGSGNVDPGNNVDCSGMVRNCMVFSGVKDPVGKYKKEAIAKFGSAEGTRQLFASSTEIKSVNNIQVGNMVALKTSSAYSHVGIISEITRENGVVTSYKVIHSGSSTGPTEVTINPINTTKGYWSSRVTGFYKWDSPDLVNIATTNNSNLEQEIPSMIAIGFEKSYIETMRRHSNIEKVNPISAISAIRGLSSAITSGSIAVSKTAFVKSAPRFW